MFPPFCRPAGSANDFSRWSPRPGPGPASPREAGIRKSGSDRALPKPAARRRWDRQVFLFPGYILTLGALAEQTEHAHCALEAAVALDGDLVVIDADGARVARQCLVAGDVPHRIEGGGRIASLWVDPAWRRFSVGAVGVPDLDPPRYQWLVRALRALDRSEPSAVQAAAVIHLWASLRLDGLVEAPMMDPRIAQALALIHAELSPRLDRYALAAEVFLSPSRFAALFVREVGVPVRTYLIWRRLLQAIRYICQGASVTQASHETGFADAAHLSRLYRQTFGSSPSLLRASRVVISDQAPADHLVQADETALSFGTGRPGCG